MDKFANLPAPLKWIIGVTGLGVLVGVGGMAGRGSWKLLLIFLAILAGLLLLFVGGFILWNYWQRRKQNARLRGELQQSTTAAPQGMSATDLAKLDSLRKKFQEGIEAFRSRGKDIYTLPWYVIIGEPGSGKTEAVRHCNVGFPPGMHEGENDTGYMGAGGTINMNWWFTNHAVLLDTAGRLVFEEVKPGESSEWKEFLKLLKKNRPNCPINGLLLVIPSDSLIKDSADQIAAKAGKIAQQLDVIQRILDFRFPVYVVITKSDKINGFREYFEGLTDPQLQHQMMGWSNPETLDSPFKPDLVDRHLSQVSERLRRRRLGLMRDPVPEGANRRIDELDSLFALPNSMTMLAPRLRRYLETIFMPGEWSAKPLFLRGIYFTSSMREGSALDQELAEAIGVSADELPEGKVWERDRAYFLRDMFMEKAFKEKGLVTRATNTSSLLKRRRMLIYASSFVALTIFVVVAWLGMRTVRGQVKDRRDYWAAATKVGWREDGVWNRPLVAMDEETGYYLSTNKFTFLEGAPKVNLGEMHQQLREQAERDIKGRWTSPRLAAGFNDNSKRSQRVLFETGVLKPLRDAVSRTMRNPTNEYARANLPDVLATLIRQEVNILDREKDASVEMDGRSASNFVGSLSRFVTGSDAAADSNLVSVMVYTYNSNRFGKGAWPPSWLSDTVRGNKGASTNLVIQNGLDYFIRNATRDGGTNWNQVTNLQAIFRAFNRAEMELFDAVKAGDKTAARKAINDIKTARTQAEPLIAGLGKNDLFKSGMTFANARQAYVNQVFGAFGKIESANNEGLKRHDSHQVFLEVSKRLSKERAEFNKGAISGADAEELTRFDEQFLGAVPGRNDAKAYDYRARLYERAAALSSDASADSNLPTDQLLARLNAAMTERNDLDKGFKSYSGYATNEVARVGQFFLGGEFAQAYMRQTTKLMDPILGFPFLRNSPKVTPASSLDSSIKAFQTIAANLKSMGDELKDQAWTSFSARMADLGTVATFLKGKDGKPAHCIVSLKKPDELTSPTERWRGRYRAIRLSTGSNPPKPLRIEPDEDQELGKVPIGQPCYFQLFQLAEDSAPALTLGDKTDWGTLALLFKSQAAKPEKEGDQNVWIVQRPVEGGNVITFKLTFDAPVPDLARWPKD